MPGALIAAATFGLSYSMSYLIQTEENESFFFFWSSPTMQTCGHDLLVYHINKQQRTSSGCGCAGTLWEARFDAPKRHWWCGMLALPSVTHILQFDTTVALGNLLEGGTLVMVHKHVRADIRVCSPRVEQPVL